MNISDELLNEFKERLHITHNSEDDNLKRLISFSIVDLQAKTGNFDVETNEQAKELVFERARYAYNDALEYFETNFISQITALGVSLAYEETEPPDEDALEKALAAYDKKPILSEGAPTAIPEYIGQTAYDRLNRIAFVAYDLTADSWQVLGSQGGGGAVHWNDLLGKPTTFPPAAHAHTAAEISDFEAAVSNAIPEEYLTLSEGDERYQPKGTGGGTGEPAAWGNITGDLANQTDLQAALNEKADADHSHLWTDIEEKPTTFPPAAHGHATAEVEGLEAALGNKADTVHNHTWNEITNKPTSYPPETHAHAIQEIEGLQTALDNKANATHGHVWADISEKPSSFPPGPHNHGVEDIIGLQAALDDKANADALAGKADVVHTHAADEITDLSEAVAEAIPADYLTQAEGDARYMLLGAGGSDAPALLAEITATQTLVNTYTKINFNRVLYDNKGGFNPVTSEYTIPESGLYMLSVSILTHVDPNTNLGVQIYRNTGGDRILTYHISPDGSAKMLLTIGGVGGNYYQAGDKIHIRANANKSTPTYIVAEYTNSYVMLTKIGN